MGTPHNPDQNESYVGEIELIIGPQHNSDGSTSSTSTTASSNIHVAATEAAGGQRTASILKNTIDSTLFAAKYIALCIISVAIYFPVFQVSMIAFYCSCSGKLLAPNWDCTSWRTTTKHSGVYHKMNHFETPKNKLRRVIIATLSRLGCLTLSLFAMSLCIPRLKRVTLLGYLMWKWSLLGIVLTLGYPCTYNSVIFFRITFVDTLITQSHDGYYAVWGLLNDTLASVLYFGWVLAAWMVYFRTERGLNLSTSDVDFVTWTLVSVLVGTILWVLKRVLILLWMANAIHRRFKARILMAGFQLFFISAIVEGMRFRFLVPCYFEEDQKPTWDIGHKIQRPDDLKDTDVRSTLKGMSPMSYMLSKHASLQQINVIAGYVADLAEVEERESEKNVVEIFKKYRQKIGDENENVEYVTEEAIRNWLKDDETELFKAALLAEFPDKTINQVPFLKWMVAAHKNCVSLGYTLIDAYAVVSVLDMILTCCILVVVALLWLLVTELATTKVLIVIASPSLAFTYIFGDTCGMFFQGVVFSFVTHPFDVGDRCLIDGVEVEVKRVNILTTTCIKIETKEKMIYPNSELVTKVIVNLESKHDPEDVIELCLHPGTSKSQILRLRRSIRNFLGSKNQRSFYQKSCRVIFEEIEDGFKMCVHFKHTNHLQDISHSDFFNNKKRRRSKLLIKVIELLEDLKIKIAHS